MYVYTRSKFALNVHPTQKLTVVRSMLMFAECPAELAPLYNCACRYVKHFDAESKTGPNAARVLTTVFYLNPDWVEADGGSLMIYGKEEDHLCEPLFNRLIVFWSDVRVPHEVLPAYSNRYAVTHWYYNSIIVSQQESEK